MEANSLSPWGATAAVQLTTLGQSLHSTEQSGYTYEFYLASGSLWISVTGKRGDQLAFRTAFSPADDLEVKDFKQEEKGGIFALDAAIGVYTVKFSLPDHQYPFLHYTVSLKPACPLHIPFWPRDILAPGKGLPNHTSGKIHVSQKGFRSGLIYASFTKPKTGSFLYFQNLTAINDYFNATETSAVNTVGGEWPEMGFSLPANPDKPLQAGKEYIISDVFVALSPDVPEDQFGVAKQFVDLLSRVYIQLPKPETIYHHYPDVLDKALEDLQNPGCWNYVSGQAYLNAYLCDYKTPPEIMVQLAVLLPLIDFVEWRNKNGMKIITDLKKALPTFYNKDLKTVMRWLPAAADKLDGSEEQKTPGVMDSWYLHHPLLNLSRLAMKGDKNAHTLFLDSLEYAQKVAKHFNYEWPVFYKMDTLEVVKAETKPGKGGEKDVPGIYAHLMLQAFELTGDKKYLKEAEKVANTLKNCDFDLFYQGNNTAFSAGAMLRLWKKTGKELYLNLSYLFIANLFKNISLWSCEYGYGPNFPTFFALFPLNDAPYTAVYEEQEAFSAINDFFIEAEGEDIMPSFSLLLAEFIRYTINRILYYYPPMLPEDMLAEEVKTGEVDPKLWIALEDIHDGWEKSGAVGQEVYGAGLAFGIVPRHFIRVKNQQFMIYLDYPFSEPVFRKNSVTFIIFGDQSLSCRLMIIKDKDEKLPEIKLESEQNENPDPMLTKDDHLEYSLNGNQKVRITWS